MFLLECPWCGVREQVEFTCQGEAYIQRPPDPQALSDQQWGDYLFFRHNPKGIHYEFWVHAHGCRRWFTVARDTASDKIIATRKPTDPSPFTISNDDSTIPQKPSTKAKQAGRKRAKRSANKKPRPKKAISR